MYINIVYDCLSRWGGGRPPLQRHQSDYGTYGGGSNSWRGGGGGGGWGGDAGRRRSEDYPRSRGPPPSLSQDEWSKPLPRDERTERYMYVTAYKIS